MWEIVSYVILGAILVGGTGWVIWWAWSNDQNNNDGYGDW